MRVPSVSQRRGTSANMTPMIDVVFLLIIFFLVSSHLARQENRLPLDLPIAASYGPTDPERAALTISVDADADWRVRGDVVDEAMLKNILRDYRERQGPTASIRVRTDRGVQYRYVEPILRAAARAGVTDATIAVREQDR